MATHLVSLLSDVEQALAEGSARRWGVSWNLNRTVNEPHQVGRITLTPPPGAMPLQTRGAIFLQGEISADGARHFKASFHWHGSDAFPVIPVAAHAPALGWKAEATRIAAIWFAGPPAGHTLPATVEFSPPAALAS